MAHKQLTPNDRYTINKLIDAGLAKAEIARILNRPTSTISREILRNTDPTFKGLYNHLVANNMLSERRINAKSKELFRKITEEVATKITDEIIKGTPPGVISKRLSMKDKIQISKNTIYRWLKIIEQKKCLERKNRSGRKTKITTTQNVLKIKNRFNHKSGRFQKKLSRGVYGLYK